MADIRGITLSKKRQCRPAPAGTECRARVIRSPRRLMRPAPNPESASNWPTSKPVGALPLAAFRGWGSAERLQVWAREDIRRSGSEFFHACGGC